MWDTAFNNISLRAKEVTGLFIDWSADHLLQISLILICVELLYRLLSKALNQLIHRLAQRRDLFPTASDRKKRLKTLDGLINASLRLVTIIIATIMIINELGVNTAPLIASASIVGVALGFGAQSLIRDFMSGFFIIVENQYRVGDVIEIAATMGGVRISGTVEAITIRTTQVRDQDGRLYHIPNGSILTTSNFTMNYAGLNELITVDKGTDVDKLAHVINHVGEELLSDTEIGPSIIEAPRFDRVDKLSGDGIVIKILGKTTPGEQWQVRGAFYKKLQLALEKNRIKLV